MQLPDKRLESFTKVELAAGQTKHLVFHVKVPDLAFFSDSANKYVAYDGEYALQLGSSSSDIAQQADTTVSGALNPVPSVVTVQAVTPSDAPAGVVQRVYFAVGATITPNLTVSLSDQSLVGYVTQGQSTPLPAGMVVRYSTDHPDVVRVSQDGTALTAVGTGPATITATVQYHGVTATGSVVVYVQ